MPKRGAISRKDKVSSLAWPLGPSYTLLRAVAKDKMNYRKWKFTEGPHPKSDFIKPAVFMALVHLYTRKYRPKPGTQGDMEEWLYKIGLRPGWVLTRLGYLKRL